MSDELTGKRVASLLANSGVEQIELTTPWQAIEDAGGTPVLVAPEVGTVQAFHNDVEKGDTFEADVATKDAVVRGKTLTSWPSLETDIRNAGASEWRDEKVVVCTDEGYPLVTSRNPDDLEAFSAALVEVVAGAEQKENAS